MILSPEDGNRRLELEQERSRVMLAVGSLYSSPLNFVIRALRKGLPTSRGVSLGVKEDGGHAPMP
jgi:hypothetical protein